MTSVLTKTMLLFQIGDGGFFSVDCVFYMLVMVYLTGDFTLVMVNRKSRGVVMMGSPAGFPDKARTFVMPDLYLYQDSTLLCKKIETVFIGFELFPVCNTVPNCAEQA